MAASLLESYGTLAAFAGRFLLPTRGRREAWLLVSDLASFRRGTTRKLTAPTGERIVVARHGGDGGPPLQAGQLLPRYELRIDGPLLLIRVPVDGVE